jgi:mevalonate kinase
MKHFHAQGKLLLSGEYFVLDGALAFAIPTSRGQQMSIEKGSAGKLQWKSFLENEPAPWFEAIFDIPSLKYLSTSDEAVAERLLELFQSIQHQKPDFWEKEVATGVNVSTQLEFPRAWGLGSSSTLVSLLAQWSDSDPYDLLEDSFGGSGYDLACATADGPIFYQKKGGKPYSVDVPFAPDFSQYLYFVYLGKKQNSREGIRRYRKKVSADKTNLIRKISTLSLQMAAARSLWEWNSYVEENEALISEALDLPTAHAAYFHDFPGTIKSLGAWGGDFVLAGSEMGEKETIAYFKERGYDTILRYREMV